MHLSGSSPVPPYGRMMIFIDGENMVCRYQDMLKQGYIPHDDAVHKPDVFVWAPRRPAFQLQHIILRATYYTYAIGSDDQLYSISEVLKRLTYPKDSGSALPNNIYPQVFKKTKGSAKGKGVDIQMTVDILTHVYQNNLETVYLISGDGDYKPVIETVVRNGKHLYMAAFSSGLNPSLPHLADRFTLLDKYYFKQDSKGNSL